MKQFTAGIVSSVKALLSDRTFVTADQYLQHLRWAPGQSLREQIDYLSSVGIYLSREAIMELQEEQKALVRTTRVRMSSHSSSAVDRPSERLARPNDGVRER